MANVASYPSTVSARSVSTNPALLTKTSSARRLVEDLLRPLTHGGQVGQVEDDELDPAFTATAVA